MITKEARMELSKYRRNIRESTKIMGERTEEKTSTQVY
jgi:hypothetical protein